MGVKQIIISVDMFDFERDFRTHNVQRVGMRSHNVNGQ